MVRVSRWGTSPTLTAELDWAAKRNGVTLTGTGHQDAYWVNLVSLPYRFGIEPLAERRRSGHVAEDRRYGLPPLLLPLVLGKRRRAGEAEARLVRILLRAFGADPHGRNRT